MLDPAGPAAEAIATLWWVMLAGGTAIFALVMAMLWLAFRRGPVPGGERGEAALERAWILRWGLGFTLSVLAALLAYGLAVGERLLPRTEPGAAADAALSEGAARPLGAGRAEGAGPGASAGPPGGPPAQSAATVAGAGPGAEPFGAAGTAERAVASEGGGVVTVSARGYRWFWVFAYADAEGLQTEDVLHIPAGRPVDVRITTGDVIHSFWVPRLAGKLDAIPGHVNVLRIEADAPGIYEGRSAEFNGEGYLAHRFEVVAHGPEDWAAFLAGGAP